MEVHKKGGPFMHKLSQKMIRITFFSVISVFLVIALLVYTVLSSYNMAQEDGMTKLISLNNGEVPQMQEYKNSKYLKNSLFQIDLDEESSYRTRYFIVYLDSNKKTVDTNIKHIASVTVGEASNLAKQVLSKISSKRNTTGYVKDYRYRIVRNETNQSLYIIFMDCSQTLLFQHTIMLVLMFTALCFTLLITLVFALFSKKAMEPFEENTKRQKQFITDASHELKTPLSIISANAQVLEYKTGQNDWTKNIVTQTQRMGSLINELLVLSKLDEMGSDILLEQIDVSELLHEGVEPFQEVAEEKNVTITEQIDSNITLYANRDALSKLISILTENATKYVTEGGEIVTSLSATKRYATISIHNTATIAEGLDYERLFDRFYRPDGSRTSSTGGHGIGLSIAKKIANQMGGTIEAKPEKDGITFIATISATMKPPKKVKK
jgi:signal transduction histidine kinase